MAFGAVQKFPNDTKTTSCYWCRYTFFRWGCVLLQIIQTKDAIKNNLINYFLTNPGERPGNPTIWRWFKRRFIFEQISTQNIRLFN